MATEDLAGTDEVYRLAVTASDLGKFAYARSGLNYALMPEVGLRWLVLCTAHDYMLIAGPQALVDAYADDPAAIASEFRAFIRDDPDWQTPENRKLLSISAGSTKHDRREEWKMSSWWPVLWRGA